MNQLNEASIVCRHVMRDFSNAAFVSHLSNGWSAGCSEDCLDQSGPAMLSMVCLGCFLDIPGIPRDFHTAPSNFAFRKSEKCWEIEYYSPYFEPEEGEFIAAPEDHQARVLKPEDEVNVLGLPNGDLVTVRLDEGTRCVPFWMREDLPIDIANKLDGSESFRAETYENVNNFARQNSIRFLAVDFLYSEFDLAVVVPDQPWT